MKKALLSTMLLFFSSTPAFAHRGEGFHFEIIFAFGAMLVFMVGLMICMYLLAKILRTVQEFLEHHKSKHP